MRTVALTPYQAATSLTLRAALEARALSEAQKARLVQLFAELLEVAPMSAIVEEHVKYAPDGVIFGTDGTPRLVVAGEQS